MKSLLASAGLALLLSFGAGCMQAPQGPRIRVATATAADLAAAENQDVVWYEFAPGDVVPVALAFFGVMEGGAQGPVGFRAKRRFWFVMSKNGPMRLSFDGQTFAQPNSSQSVIAVMPRKDGQGGQLGWFIYMGESGDPEAELKELIERPASDKPQQQAKR
jgi:hypothetical protein